MVPEPPRPTFKSMAEYGRALRAQGQEVTHTLKNNLAFFIFMLLIIIVYGLLFCAFFVGYAGQFNAYILGKFKRPMVTHPEKYFDVNCINTHSKEDFLNLSQVQRCRLLRPIDRPGPPTRFS